MQELLEGLWLELTAWLIVASGGGVLCAGPWLLRRSPGTLLPPQRHRSVPWRGFEVIGALVLALLWWPPALYGLLKFLAALCGEQQEEDDKLLLFLANVLALPFQVASVFLLLGLASGTRPYQVGVTTHRLRANVAAGYFSWLVLSPAVHVLHFAVLTFYVLLEERLPKPHDLTQLLRDRQPVLEWTLFWVQAVVAAPVLEELLFRGVLQAWLLCRPWGGHLAMAAALALSPRQVDDYGLAPVLFVLALLPGYVALPLFLRQRTRSARGERDEWALPRALLPSTAHVLEGSPAAPVDAPPPAERLTGPPLVTRTGLFWGDPLSQRGRAIYGTAAVFAVIHDWPTPIPLFVLGLGLGWLAYRTQSLVGPMVLHGLFNSVACVEQWLAR